MDENGNRKITDGQLAEMVSHITDPNVRKHFENVIGGVVEKEVVCLKCKQVIGHYYQDGQLIEVHSETTTGKGLSLKVIESGCLSSRQRLDGHMGYSCRCGNWSIQSQAEQGIMSATAPSKGDLEQIYNRLQDKPTQYKTDGMNYAVDGFLVRPYSGKAGL